MSIAAIRQPAFLYDAHGTVVSANESAEALADRSFDGLSAEDVADIFGYRRMDGALLAPAELPARRALRGEEVSELLLAVSVASADTVRVLVSASPVYEGDAIAGALVLWQDTPWRMRTGPALLGDATDLQESRAELRRIVDVASHDLQEPLRRIVSFSQLLERRYQGRLDADADEYIRFIVEGGRQMQSLIRDVLQLTRIESVPLQPVRTSAIEAVIAACVILEAAMQESNASVLVFRPPAVMADPDRLEQVFVHLIGNAVKFRRSGVAPAIEIRGRRAGPVVEFSVQDNGIGIEPEYYHRIFEMFRRLHTHEACEGTGIGLTVVKKIVERHGGEVWVESAPGEGSTFFFTLPAA